MGQEIFYLKKEKKAQEREEESVRNELISEDEMWIPSVKKGRPFLFKMEVCSGKILSSWVKRAPVLRFGGKG